MVLSFGKYKGWDIEELPDTYLIWLLEQDWLSPIIRPSIVAEAAARDLIEGSQEPSQIDNKQIAAIYKELAKKHHPDKGGSTQAMQAINEFYTLLKELDL